MFHPPTSSSPQLISMLKSCIYLMGGVIILGFLHFSPFILSTIASLIVLTGYVYTTLGLTFLIGYHVCMLFTYLKHYGTKWVKNGSKMPNTIVKKIIFFIFQMKYKGNTKLEKKCLSYIRDNLKAPPQSVVTRWGKKLGLDSQEIKQINDRVHLRAHLGPDPGFLSNTKNWKKTTPRSFRSPYYVQGDIGNENPSIPVATKHFITLVILKPHYLLSST
jgi:hypothetical protein